MLSCHDPIPDTIAGTQAGAIPPPDGRLVDEHLAAGAVGRNQTEAVIGREHLHRTDGA